MEIGNGITTNLFETNDKKPFIFCRQNVYERTTRDTSVGCVRLGEQQIENIFRLIQGSECFLWTDRRIDSPLTEIYLV